MKIEFICGTLCMLAILLFVLMFTRRRENFASFDARVNMGDVVPPNPNKPDSNPSASLRFDVSGNGAIPISISNLSDLVGASPTSLKGKNLPAAVDPDTSVDAAKLKSKQDAMANTRRSARRKQQNKRRFMNPTEDADADVEADADADADAEDMTPPMPYRPKRRSPALDQGTQYMSQGQGQEQGHTDECEMNTKSACESPDYIQKDKIPCYGCTLPTSTD